MIFAAKNTRTASKHPAIGFGVRQTGAAQAAAPVGRPGLELGYAPRSAMTKPRTAPIATMARLFKEQLERAFRPPKGVRARFVEGAHSGGKVASVYIEYEPHDAQAARFAWQVAQNLPTEWDGAAMAKINRAALAHH